MGNYSCVNTKMGSFNHVRYSNGNCYHVCAVLPIYDVGSHFRKMRVELAKGNVLYINKEDYYAFSLKGKVSYFDVMKGGELEKICSKK